MAFLGGGRRGVARYADGDMAPPAPGRPAACRAGRKTECAYVLDFCAATKFIKEIIVIFAQILGKVYE